MLIKGYNETINRHYLYLLYYIGIWPLEDLTKNESQLKIPSKTEKSLGYIKSLFPKIEGFEFAKD